MKKRQHRQQTVDLWYPSTMDWISFLRQYRLGGFAIFDFTSSFLGMWLLSPLLSGLCKKIGYLVPKRNWVFLTLPLSVLVHVLIGRITPLTGFVLDLSGHYFAKLVIVGCLFFSLTGIKKTTRTHKQNIRP